MIIYQKVKAICSISIFTLFRNGKTSTVYYRTLSFFGFCLKKNESSFLDFKNTKSPSNLFASCQVLKYNHFASLRFA